MTTEELWPKRPYRGLDYYEEADASLFRERDQDVEKCLRLLLAFRTKIILLQGSSGSGKSSFLRAGLVHALKRLTKARTPPPWTPVLLNVDQGVLRSTADPMLAIATALRRAMNEASPMSAPIASSIQDSSLAAPLDDATRNWIIEALDATETDGYRRSPQNIIEILSILTASRDIKLFLFIDQAEEVLTRTTGTQAAGPQTKAFFYFLEELCFRNINLRVVISLRTEYYGRFRDEFGISELSIGTSQRDLKIETGKETGVEAFLLRPLRDRDALLRAFRFPALAVRPASDGGGLVYSFNFEDGLLEKIVEDVLAVRELGDGAVTPLISMICSELYGRLPPNGGLIGELDYDGVRTILQEYFEKGIAGVAEPGSSEATKWEELLFETLVSRQGGGTVVSMTETVEAFVSNARQLEIEASNVVIQNSLANLACGNTPLLREIPASDGTAHFCLKHDALALVIDRRRIARKGSEREARLAEEARKSANEAKQREEAASIRAASETARAEMESARADSERNKARAARFQFFSIAATISAIVIAVAAAAGFVIYSNDNAKTIAIRISQEQLKSSFEFQIKIINATNTYAMRPVRTREGDDLDILTRNLLASREYLNNEQNSSVDASILEDFNLAHDETLKDLRNVLVRSSVQLDCEASGYDQQNKRVACLKLKNQNGESFFSLEIHTFNGSPLEDNITECYDITTELLGTQLNPWGLAVGFMGDVGPVLYSQGRLYNWKESDKRQGSCHAEPSSLDLSRFLQSLELSPFPLQYVEIAGGWATIRNYPLPPGMKNPGIAEKVLRFNSSIFRPEINTLPVAEFLKTVPHVDALTALPQLLNFGAAESFVSLDEKGPQLNPERCYRTLELPKAVVGKDLQANLNPPKCNSVVLNIGRVSTEAKPFTVPIGADSEPPPLWPPTRRWTYAPVSSNPPESAASAAPIQVATKGWDTTVEFLAVSAGASTVNPAFAKQASAEMKIDLDSVLKIRNDDKLAQIRIHNALTLASSANSFLPPAFAASVGENLNRQVAWIGNNGLWFTRNDPTSLNVLRSPFSGTLFASENEGARLQFSDDGEQLVLFEQPRGQPPVNIRVYDVSPGWIQSVLGSSSAMSEQQVLDLACRILRRDEARENRSGPSWQAGPNSRLPDMEQPEIVRPDQQPASPCVHRT